MAGQELLPAYCMRSQGSGVVSSRDYSNRPIDRSCAFGDCYWGPRPTNSGTVGATAATLVALSCSFQEIDILYKRMINRYIWRFCKKVAQQAKDCGFSRR